MTSQQFDAAMVDASGSFLARRTSIAELAGKFHLPMIYPFRDYVDAGGLMSYTPPISASLPNALPSTCNRSSTEPSRATSRSIDPTNSSCSSI